MFKSFSLKFLNKYPGDHRSDFIRDALTDEKFPWELERYEVVEYLECQRADPECITCYEELVDLYALNC